MSRRRGGSSSRARGSEGQTAVHRTMAPPPSRPRCPQARARKHGPLRVCWRQISVIPYRPAGDALLLDPTSARCPRRGVPDPADAHQSHCKAAAHPHGGGTSPSPAREVVHGDESRHGTGPTRRQRVLLCDSIPAAIVHNLLQTERALESRLSAGRVPLQDASPYRRQQPLHHAAGEAVINPLSF